MGRRAETGVSSSRIVGSFWIDRHNEVDIREAEAHEPRFFFYWGLAVSAATTLPFEGEGDLPNRWGGLPACGHTQAER